MSKVAAAVAVVLGLAVAGVFGLGLAIGNGSGPYAPEAAFGPDEVLSADGAVALDDAAAGPWAELDLDVPSLEAVLRRLDADPRGARVLEPDRIAGRGGGFLDAGGESLAACVRVTVACSGRVTSVGTPEDIARARQGDTDAFPLQLSPVRVAGPFGEAVRWTGSVSADGHGLWLTEWMIDHDGALLTVGYMRDSADPDRTELVEQMLAGLTWRVSDRAWRVAPRPLRLQRRAVGRGQVVRGVPGNERRGERDVEVGVQAEAGPRRGSPARRAPLTGALQARSLRAVPSRWSSRRDRSRPRGR